MNAACLKRLHAFRSFALIACLILGAAMPSRAAASDTLLDFGSFWTYWDFGYDADSGWNSEGYDDDLWNFGSGQFGYGEGDESTLVSYGSNSSQKYVTSYFRTWVYVPNPSQYAALRFRLLLDPGAIVYLNGGEVFRANMPGGQPAYNTPASGCLGSAEETNVVEFSTSPANFNAGYNLVAVEVHQCAPAADDLSFDLAVFGDESANHIASVSRGPYLQVGTWSNMTVRWRTSVATTTRVQFGLSAASLDWSVTDLTETTDHEITLTNLAPYTKYFYDIGTDLQKLAGDSSYYFITAPTPGTVQPVRFWAIGDFGTGFAAQYQVRDAYANFTGSRYTDLWLMLGDNAYGEGTDAQYQSYCFNVYQTMLRQSCVWPTLGNHDAAFDPQGGAGTGVAYYQIFTLPTNGVAGGVPSGSEHYYSFDYANIHFVCLNSQAPLFADARSPMMQWLNADLADTMREWVVVFFHHPPYSKGSHDSEVDGDLIRARTKIAPTLDNFGVDLVLSGHSHSYERSYLINGHYGKTNTINPTNFISQTDGRTNGGGAYLKPSGGIGANRGTVYIVDGSSGGQYGYGTLDHQVMFHSTLDYGSLVVDVNGLRLDAKFVRSDGQVTDYFTIDKSAPTTNRPAMTISRAGPNALITWPTSNPIYDLVHRREVDSGLPWTPTPGIVFTNGRRRVTSVPIQTGTNQFFRLRQVP
jgi:acid phosphatase type 7